MLVLKLEIYNTVLCEEKTTWFLDKQLDNLCQLKRWDVKMIYNDEIQTCAWTKPTCCVSATKYSAPDYITVSFSVRNYDVIETVT